MMKIDYELVEKIGATHYNQVQETYVKIHRGVLHFYDLHSGSWVSTVWDSFHTVKLIPQKRTRTEYEKVTESIFDLRDEFECGELYESVCGSRLENEHDFIYAYTHGHIVRKIEKEIDWREDVFSFTKSINGKVSFADGFSVSKMSEEQFLELCRVALRANGELD
ncbi:hypothetical protein vBVnaSL3_45 [Vibrio phage vB_VnaS-L3]|nr:hypothetical protein vBVnaSL3_45 [Vibrio phage vB_VnaS-L3]